MTNLKNLNNGVEEVVEDLFNLFKHLDLLNNSDRIVEILEEMCGDTWVAIETQEIMEARWVEGCPGIQFRLNKAERRTISRWVEYSSAA